jgi:acetoacetyl-CoA synthetase
VTVLWTPPPDVFETTEIGRFARRNGFDSFAALQQWSVRDLEGFWQAVWDFFGLRWHTPPERVLGSRAMPGAEWFPGARLNYAEHMLGDDPRGGGGGCALEHARADRADVRRAP